jgi:beta-glucanase (GH16 family)
VWQDNFTGSSVTDNWDYITGGSGFGDQSLQWFGDTNAATGPDGLTITAAKGGSDHTCWYGSCVYASAEIKTSFAQEYGRFEARIKIPGGSGLWPAFWMLPVGGTQGQRTPGEIDVMEVNNRNPNEITGYVHDAEFFNYKALKVLSARPSSGFHTYGIDWTPGGITWTFDGVSYGHVSEYSGWPFNQPFYMLLDLAVGGSWPGSPTASTVFPAELQVSWIRVYQMAGLSHALRSKGTAVRVTGIRMGCGVPWNVPGC